MKRINNYSLIFLLLLVFCGQTLKAEVRLPKLISDGMVLQRNQTIKIWGWANAEEKVTVEFHNSEYFCRTNDQGEWEIQLPELDAGGPFEMTIRGKNTIHLKDIVIGDVWICSGQSNMELSMQRVSPLYPDEIEHAENPFIRQFKVPREYNFQQPQSDTSGGNWQKATPESVLDFSAVAYFFARSLYDSIQVPIGLINTSLGGSPVEAWIDEESIKKFPSYYEEEQRFKNQAFIDRIQKEDQNRSQSWYQELNRKDQGYPNDSFPWFHPGVNTANWQTMTLPGYWADYSLGAVNGVVWFRKEIDVPASMAGKQAKLNLGRIVDADSVFVNGIFVGTTSYQYPPRRYEVPASVLKKGKNTLVVRVINSAGRGGFVPDKPYELIVGKQKIDLKGEWRYRLGAKMEPLASQAFIRWKPVGLYNAMIAPLLNFGIKGAIWYQGESNANRPDDYCELFKCMIQSWRTQWQQGDFPFLFVQLPNFMEENDQPSSSNWALLREAQLKALALPNTGMAVAIDLGEWNDIHPLNKKDLSQRLARSALNVAYHNEKIVFSGPIFKSFKIEGSKIYIDFKHLGSGLMVKGESELTQFAIAGPDRQFVWATAKIVGTQVEVESDQIAQPVAVRYAWSDNPQGANLYNKEGLPASPFRTDCWEK